MQPEDAMVRNFLIRKRLNRVCELLECDGGRSSGLLFSRNNMVRRLLLSVRGVVDD